jgi:hypothetical protein
MIFRL